MNLEAAMGRPGGGPGPGRGGGRTIGHAQEDPSVYLGRRPFCGRL